MKLEVFIDWVTRIDALSDRDFQAIYSLILLRDMARELRRKHQRMTNAQKALNETRNSSKAHAEPPQPH